MSKNPYAPKKDSETPAPKSASKNSKPAQSTPYKWPGEAPKGKGDFNRVSDNAAGPARVVRSNFMK